MKYYLIKNVQEFNYSIRYLFQMLLRTWCTTICISNLFQYFLQTPIKIKLLICHILFVIQKFFKYSKYFNKEQDFYSLDKGPAASSVMATLQLSFLDSRQNC